MSSASLKSEFLEAMSRAACTISIVTTDGAGGKAGVTVSAMASVSADTPTPSLLVCVHHLSRACAAIRSNGIFCINMLHDDQSAISDIFAGRLAAGKGDKFDSGRWTSGIHGAPVLTGALATFECDLAHDLRWGSHHVFIGNAVHVATAANLSPLIYANRRYGRAEPLA
jgi:flavin reductase